MSSVPDVLVAAMPAGLTVVTDPPPGRDLTGPHIIVTGGTGIPELRRIAGHGAARRHLWQIMCVSNTHAGAVLIASLVVETLDGAFVGAGTVCAVEYVTQPIEDRDDPTEWCWTVTVEAIHY